MGRIRLAFDFDGVLNRLPKPFEIFMRYSGPNDVFSRTGLDKLEKIIVLLIAIFPLNLNGKIINAIPKDSIVISGRTTQREKAEYLLRRVGLSNLYFRQTLEIPETTFKIETCKKLGVELFVEDRTYVIERLKANGINGVDVREWVKL